MDIFDKSKVIQLGFCTDEEQWSNALFPKYFWFASWGKKICCKDKRTYFMATDNGREVIKSQPWRKPTLQGHISSYSIFELECRVGLSF